MSVMRWRIIAFPRVNAAKIRCVATPLGCKLK